MKRLFSILFCFSCLISFADDDSKAPINLQHNGPGNHSGIPVPADEPDVYYDSDAQQIIIDGMGFVSYYDVEITSMSTWAIVLTVQVDGSYDTIDISSLPVDDYLITIDTPLGNTYEGYFDTY